MDSAYGIPLNTEEDMLAYLYGCVEDILTDEELEISSAYDEYVEYENFPLHKVIDLNNPYDIPNIQFSLC